MMKINGKPMIYWQIQRILQASRVNELVVATSVDTSDDQLADFLNANSINVHRGSMHNVLSRFTEVGSKYPHSALIRLTGDCPLVMPELIDQMVDEFYGQKVDYLSNTLEPTFPDGLDIEILRHGVLEELTAFRLGSKELEHVTYGVYTRADKFKLSNYVNQSDRSLERWTVDYPVDFDFVTKIFNEFAGRESDFTYKEVCEFLEKYPTVNLQNDTYMRNAQLEIHERQR
jgi:spore coat polysaccharide biosynthesis protein SpsF (cytidylyltransferase family)